MAHDEQIEVNTPSFASGPEKKSGIWGSVGCEADHHCQRNVDPFPTTFSVPLGIRPQQDSDYRVQVRIEDPQAVQANTVIQGQRWWLAGWPGEDLWGHHHDTPKIADQTCYGEDLEQRIQIVGTQLVTGKRSHELFDCGSDTPLQTYHLVRATRKFRGRWVWQYEDYNKIVAGSPYEAGGRLYDLRIEPRNGTVALVGTIEPTLPALSLIINVRWWRRKAFD